MKDLFGCERTALAPFLRKGHLSLCPNCLGACLSLAWRVMVLVSGRGSSGCSVTVAEDAPLDSTAGHLRSCSDLHGSGCARIRRSCSCGTTGRRICRSRGVSVQPLLTETLPVALIPRAPVFAGQTASHFVLFNPPLTVHDHPLLLPLTLGSLADRCYRLWRIYIRSLMMEVRKF